MTRKTLGQVAHEAYNRYWRKCGGSSGVPYRSLLEGTKETYEAIAAAVEREVLKRNKVKPCQKKKR